MHVIHKYLIEIDSDQDIYIPAGSVILSVQIQNHEPVLWAIIDPSKPIRARKIKIFATGEKTPDFAGLIHIATIQRGSFVFHCFDAGERDV